MIWTSRPLQEYAIWISRLGDITFVLKTGPQPAERTRPDRKGIGFARPSPGPIRPHDRTVRPGRQWTTIDRDHRITVDPLPLEVAWGNASSKWKIRLGHHALIQNHASVMGLNHHLKCFGCYS
ncbi:unnamed protein product [Microthlaspi erraticum]|uniref:Uncharacterized protein n=1 Tax=Microthlaspi erraticum TaxID=1685480 RepID=A0A6D2L128_9BRAS|nr:unnamed protein product [Microthlaspi erraticum]